MKEPRLLGIRMIRLNGRMIKSLDVFIGCSLRRLPPSAVCSLAKTGNNFE